MIEVVNRQRKVPVELEKWQRFTRRALKVAPTKSANVTIAFVSNRRMRELNRQWRGKTGTTDVLSFPADGPEPELGDIAVSVETAARQAKENGLSFDNEIAQLILHGLLHLTGYDHETDNGEMNRFELRLRRKLRI